MPEVYSGAGLSELPKYIGRRILGSLATSIIRSRTATGGVTGEGTCPVTCGVTCGVAATVGALALFVVPRYPPHRP